MEYTNFIVNNQTFDLTHLNPFSLFINVDNTQYEVNVIFGNHCFTDEQGNGPVFGVYESETRYWSSTRYYDSHNLPDIIKNLIQDKSTYVVPYKSKKKEQYHYLEDGYYAIFFKLSGIDNENKKFNFFVLSAYDKTTYNGAMPNGKRYKLSYVFSKRLSKKLVLS